MLRGGILMRRGFARHVHRRHLHEDSRGEFLGFSVAKIPGSDPRFGMDMTRAPGYEVAAEDDMPLVGNQKVADFAVRHARLSSSQVEHANGYIWVGSVLYPAGFSSDADVAFSWEIVQDDRKDFDEEDEYVPDLVERLEPEEPALEAKRRYTGGQARRIRKDREHNANKRALRSPNRRPIRRPENDVPPEEE